MLTNRRNLVSILLTLVLITVSACSSSSGDGAEQADVANPDDQATEIESPIDPIDQNTDGDSGSESQTDNTATTDEEPEEFFLTPELSTVTLKFGLLASLENGFNQYTASSFFEPILLDSTGSGEATIHDENTANIIVVSDTDDSPVFVHYVEPIDSATQAIELDARTMALGLVAINPLISTFDSNQKNDIVQSATDYELFDTIVLRINEAVRRNRIDLLAESDPIELLKLSSELSLELVGNISDELVGSSFTRAAGDRIGGSAAPYLFDEIGEDVLFVNPTLAFYGVAINDSDYFLLSGRDKLWSIIDNTSVTANKTQQRQLDQGINNVVFTIGRDDLDVAGRLALFANAVRLFCYIGDVFVPCPLSNDQITGVAERLLNSSDEELKKIFDGFLTTASFAAIGESINYLGKLTNPNGTATNFNRMYKFLTFGADQRFNPHRKFLQPLKKIVANLGSALKVLKGLEATQSHLPFLVHYAFKPSRLQFCVNNRGGDLVNECEEQSRTPSPVLSASATQVVTGSEIDFTVRNADDVEIGPAELIEYRWDIGNDGVIEQDWQAGANTYTGLFELSGVYSVRVDARNQFGGVNATALAVEVTDSLERIVTLDHPEASGKPVFITRVSLTSSETEVVFTVKSSGNACWYETGVNSPYLLAQSKKHSLRSADNVEFCESFINYPAGSTFSLTFDPIPLESITVDLIEGEAAENGEPRFFNYFDVQLPLGP